MKICSNFLQKKPNFWRGQISKYLQNVIEKEKKKICVENFMHTVEKGGYHQLLLFSQCFKKLLFQGCDCQNYCYQHFLLFPQCFPPFLKLISIFQSYLFCRLQMLSVWASLIISCFRKSYVAKWSQVLTTAYKKAFENTVERKKKCLLFYFIPFPRLISSFGEHITLSQTTYFKLFQIETVCRQQF